MQDNEIIDLIANAFDVDSSKIDLNTKRDDIEEWDSMGMLVLMADLDEQLGIEIDEDAFESLETINDIVTLVNQAKAA